MSPFREITSTPLVTVAIFGQPAIIIMNLNLEISLKIAVCKTISRGADRAVATALDFGSNFFGIESHLT